MRSDYISGGVVLLVFGIIALAASGGLTFWFTGSGDGGSTTGATTIGMPGIIGWALIVGGVILLLLGALAESRAEAAAPGRRKDKDITIVKT